MSAPARSATVDLALSLLLAGCAVWAGMEWLRAAYREALEDARRDLDGLLDSAVHAAVEKQLLRAWETPPPEPKANASSVAAPKMAARRKVPRQGDPAE